MRDTHMIEVGIRVALLAVSFVLIALLILI